MSNVIRINACVYTRMGYGRNRNTSDFYMNGRFLSEQHLDNVQASMENRGSEYLFALADNMENTADATASVSILKELTRLHERISANESDLDTKMREIASRVGGAARLLDSILEMNHTPLNDVRRNVGFSSLLLADGHAVAATVGQGHAYLMREDSFQPLARENSSRERLVNLGVLTEEESERPDLHIPQEEEPEEGDQQEGPVVLSDPMPYCENDTFLLVSHGIFETLGEERVEDILASGGESSAIASRMVTEAMKRTHRGDLSAMAVQIDKIYDVQGAARKPMIKSRVDALSRTPPVTYKYNRKPVGRENFIFAGLFGLIVVVVLIILYIIISSLINPKEPGASPSASPSVSVSASAGTTPAPSAEVTPEPTPEPSVEATPEPAEETTYTVKSGDTLSGIVRSLYGDVSLLEEFQTYNGISDPTKIQIGQILKVPAAEVLKGN